MSISESVNLSDCDREPIHIPGSIQPHGGMLVVEPTSHRLLFASANIPSLTGYDGDLIPGLDISLIFGEKNAHEIRNAAAKAGHPGLSSVLLGLRLPGRMASFDVMVHTHGDRTFVEIEPCLDRGRSARAALDLTRSLIHRIGLEQTPEKIATAGARLVRAMLGYDRVMVYRFLHNGAGRVIAEAKSPSLGSFMGQHFPAADIPAQARRLYLANTIRMIADIGYRPVALAPPLGPGEEPIDMSHAQLRSVSPIHCQYLRNMGVAASLSISIVVNGELWGLIACHHDTPRLTPMPLRIGAELFGQYFSLQIAASERRTALKAAADARARLDQVLSQVGATGSIREGMLDRLADFASLAACDGAGLWMDGAWRAHGDALDAETARRMLDVAHEKAPQAVWTTDELRAYAPGTTGAVAGMIAIPLSMSIGDYLVLFRNEEAHRIEWAGEPIKLKESTPHGERLTPRGSFETWREEVRGRCAPWSEADRSAAEAVGLYLRDMILREREISEKERERTEQRRHLLNAELNHRVKNIIALVKSIAVQTGASAASVEDYSEILEGRLRALAHAHDQALGESGGDLMRLLEAETRFHRSDAGRVVLAGPEVYLDRHAYGALALVMHEMMTNAAKYGALSVATGRLAIAWDLDAEGACEIAWSESGGPRIAPPSHSGFGTQLIHSSVEHDLQGGVRLDYDESGLQARFTIPAAHLGVGSEAGEAMAAEAGAPDLAGLSILVVEDQSLIAMDMEETLRRLGARDMRFPPNVAEALKTLETFRPHIALLDFNLGRETAEAVGQSLRDSGVPFLFATGYNDRVMIPERFRDVPVVRKPVSEQSIREALALLIKPKA